MKKRKKQKNKEVVVKEASTNDQSTLMLDNVPLLNQDWEKLIIETPTKEMEADKKNKVNEENEENEELLNDVTLQIIPTLYKRMRRTMSFIQN